MNTATHRGRQHRVVSIATMAAGLASLFAVLLTAAPSAEATSHTHAPAHASGAPTAHLVQARAAVKGDDDCLGPDIRCDVTAGAKAVAGAAGDAAAAAGGVAGAAKHVAGAQIPDPFAELGDQMASAVADAWTAGMLSLWSAGLYVLKLVLTFADHFLTPDLATDGPGQDVYAYTFWIASVLVVVMAMIQLGVAAFRREGKSLARVAVGGAQFVIVWAAWLGYCVVVVAACSGLTRGLMEALLGVSTWSKWDPLSGIDAGDITDGAVATVLGLLGLVLWLAALGHLLIMLARAASLIVLVATGPISAAGLLADAGRSWFWKSLRWFHAAAFTPVVMVLVLGLGVQLATGVAAGLSDSTAKAIGTALPSVMLICVACVAPLALFKLLAFVDPGTASGASFRQGMAMQGGLQGLVGGGSSGFAGSSGGSAGSAASSADGNGRSAGESGAEGSTNDRFSQATQNGLSSFGGAVGGALAKGMGAVQKVGTQGASLMSDETNQTGVGHHTYGPDFSNIRSSGSSSSASSGNGRHPADDGGGGGGGGPDGGSGAGCGDGGDQSGESDASNPAPQAAPPQPIGAPPAPAAQANSAGGSGDGGTSDPRSSGNRPGGGKPGGGKPGGAGGGASGAGGAAAEAPVVPA